MAGDDKSAELYGSTIASAIVGIFFAAARFYTGRVLLRRYHFEDWIIAISAVLLILATVTGCLCTKSGLGRHWDTLKTDEKINAKFYFALSTWGAIPSLGLPKLAVTALLCRVFSPGPRTRWFLWGVVSLGMANHLSETCLSTFQCSPVQALWDFRIEGAHCVDLDIYRSYSYYNGVYSAFADFVLAIYPAAVFRKMNYNWLKKLGLSFIMGLGVFATGTACLKTSYLNALVDPDFTWAAAETAIWTYVEAAVIMAAASIPVLHPLFDVARRKVRKLLGSDNRDSRITTVSRSDRNAPKAGFWTKKMQALMQLTGTASTGLSTWSGERTLKTIVPVQGEEVEMREADEAGAVVQVVPSRIVFATTTDLEIGLVDRPPDSPSDSGVVTLTETQEKGSQPPYLVPK